VILFTVDVGVRRIQLDRDEISKAIHALRRWIFFWQGVPRTPEAEESLAALLSRREQVRSKQPVPMLQPRADLFRPEKTVSAPLPGTEEASEAEIPPVNSPIEPAKPAADQEPPATTTSRLLEAKRRAQKRKP